MRASQLRTKFFQFFEKKNHEIVSSAPIINKNDPTLLFTNAGMNQFKDVFLGHKTSKFSRIANTQKCLRVSGKHNDLEEVGIDSYHHTMFEMLGNWSFGDYFKNEAIAWAWEFLIDDLGLDKDRMYVTVFGGDKEDNLERDTEASAVWARVLPKERILDFGKKDNFWEMGETGPCGPCSEIHYDLRLDEERSEIPAQKLINQDHPHVIEIWNLVFIQYNRMADRSLVNLPEKHVDTGMGFERLCMVVQDKKSNYDTDLFTPILAFIEQKTGKKYGNNYDHSAKTDIAFRVVSDHLRAVCFTICDGELPNNTGAGYVIRRILRRAVRYYYSFLGMDKPFLCTMVDLIEAQFSDVFPEITDQKEFVKKVIFEEEKSFLSTLEEGLKRIESVQISNNSLNGTVAFELYDTYGFPIDLTRLIAQEKGWKVDENGFEKALQEQKNRSKLDAKSDKGDWTTIKKSTSPTIFVGYDQLTISDASILKYRKVTTKKEVQYHAILDKTPFYAESGGQVGDNGFISNGDEEIEVIDTIIENDQIIHVLASLPKDKERKVSARVDDIRREQIEKNHSATHLLQAALRNILGDHAQQRGSLVNDEYLRFDFSHFNKMTENELLEVEDLVNREIRNASTRIEHRSILMAEAKELGATMLFGEKYGDHVRAISFGDGFSTELCGGCHTKNTAHIGSFKIISETAIAAGIRRIVAKTGEAADRFIADELHLLDGIRQVFKNPSDLEAHVQNLLDENKQLKKTIEKLQADQASGLVDSIKKKITDIHGIKVLSSIIPISDSKAVKTVLYNIEKELGDIVVAFGFVSKNKPQLMIAISQSLTEKGLHAGNIIREAAKEIGGGGGGQPFFASAGGKNVDGLQNALNKVIEIIAKE